MALAKKLIRGFLMIIASLMAFILLSNLWIVYSTSDRIYKSISEVPAKKIGLVLGTTHRLKTGQDNPYFTERIRTAAKLYKQNKVEHFILSGDNNTIYYNEPLKMQTALIEAGVPESAITLDYAGFRTLDSVIRCKEVFGQDQIVIITQEFHSYRALFISDYYSIKAVAMVANNAPFPSSFSVIFREVIARPKAVIDLYILKKSPKFLGEKEYI